MVNFASYTSKALYSENNPCRVVGQDQNQMQLPDELTYWYSLSLKDTAEEEEIVAGGHGKRNFSSCEIF